MAEARPRVIGEVLLVNGGFLMAAGAGQVALELAGNFGAGPYARMFRDSPYTIGFVEAHGLAALVGAMLFSQRHQPYRRLNHVLALCVHILLGGSNILFWRSFSAFGLVRPGIMATIGHVVFTVAHIAILRRAGKGS